jgi:hypothetical protein
LHLYLYYILWPLPLDNTTCLFLTWYQSGLGSRTHRPSSFRDPAAGLLPASPRLGGSVAGLLPASPRLEGCPILPVSELGICCPVSSAPVRSRPASNRIARPPLGQRPATCPSGHLPPARIGSASCPDPVPPGLLPIAWYPDWSPARGLLLPSPARIT